MNTHLPLEKRLDIFGDLVDYWRCHKCKQWLPLNKNFFFTNKAKKSGFCGECKVCSKARARNYTSKENKKTWFSARARSASDRARKKGLDFKLKYDDLEYPDFCPKTKIKLSYATSVKDSANRQRDHAASLDRIDSSKGYVAGNVRVVSWAYNRMKGTSTDDRVDELCRRIIDSNSA